MLFGHLEQEARRPYHLLYLKCAQVLHEAQGKQGAEAENHEVYGPLLEHRREGRHGARQSTEEVSGERHVEDAATECHQCHR